MIAKEEIFQKSIAMFPPRVREFHILLRQTGRENGLDFLAIGVFADATTLYGLWASPYGCRAAFSQFMEGDEDAVLPGLYVDLMYGNERLEGTKHYTEDVDENVGPLSERFDKANISRTPPDSTSDPVATPTTDEMTLSGRR